MAENNTPVPVPYRWDWSKEIVLAAISAAVMAIFQIMMSFDPQALLADPNFWVITSASTIVRAVGAAGVNVVARLWMTVKGE